MAGARFGRGAWSAVLLVLGVVLWSCGEDGGTTTPETTTIEVAVTADGSPESGVSVALYEQGGGTALETAMTGSDGTATFTGVEPGTYEVELTVPSGFVLSGGASARQSVTTSAGETETVGFALESDGSGSEVVVIELTSELTFSPDNVSIEPGTTVRWVNGADIFHTITPDEHDEWTRVEMDTADETFEHTFNTAGTFPYYCEPHLSAGMTGTIVVETQ